MLWLVVIILSYFFFAVVSLGDRYLLVGKPNPKTYTFYVGILGALCFVIIPFVNFFIPGPKELLLCFLGGFFYLLSLYFIYRAIDKIEISRVTPGVGALIPLITFIIIFILSDFKESLDIKNIIAFFILAFGSVLISQDFSKKNLFKNFGAFLFIAFFASLNFVFSKYVYLVLPFWTGFIWMRTFSFFLALLFLLSKTVRKEFLGRKSAFGKNKSNFFVFNQVLGALAYVLQSWGIALAGLMYLPIINALQGSQYAFMFALIILLSWKFPKLLSENFKKKIILQKVIAVVIIASGLVLLALN
jgi:uncharacterized membrane protein